MPPERFQTAAARFVDAGKGPAIDGAEPGNRGALRRPTHHPPDQQKVESDILGYLSSLNDQRALDFVGEDASVGDSAS
jgi:hypothetical protein